MEAVSVASPAFVDEKGASKSEKRRLAPAQEEEGLKPHPPRTCPSCCCCPLTRGIVGRSYWFCGHRKPRPDADPDDRESKFTPCCLLGPNWGCFLATQALIYVPSAAFFFFVGTLIHPGITAGAAALVFTVLALHYAIGCSNPGILLKQSHDAFTSAPSSPTRMSMCRYCNIMRPANARHCAECDVCILELDHHCPYMSKCVAKNNIKAFKAFNVLIMILVCYLLAVRLALLLCLWLDDCGGCHGR